MKRQRIRKMILILMLLFFPITIWYFSPYLIIMGAMEGIINGSFLVFCVMTILSIFFGRTFCSYLCPIGGLQECLTLVNDKAPKQGYRNKIKYVIWAVWIMVIAACFLLQKNRLRIDFLYQTDHGISVSNIYCYLIYYVVIFLAVIPSVLWGKRLICHYFCWMAPFMVIGTKIRRVLHLPGLHIVSDKEKCVSCRSCNRKCPMGLEVSEMVKTGGCYSNECIQCGECVDTCPHKVLSYSMRREEKR